MSLCLTWIFIQSGHQYYLQQLFALAGRVSPRFALAGRASQTFPQKLGDTGWSLCSKFCVYVPLPYLLVCSTSTIHRVQGGLKPHSYLLKIQVRAYSQCWHATRGCRAFKNQGSDLELHLLKCKLISSGAGQNISVNIVSTSSKYQDFLMNSNTVMKKEVVIP